MNSIPDDSSTGLLQDRSNLQDTSFSSHERKLSVNTFQKLDAGLTIQTREGDIVTLSSNQFSELNAFEYNRQGQIRTDAGIARISQHFREINLTSGEQFSFSVQGDLNEQELADIEAIVKGVDGIIAEMIQGDMEDAISKAMSMGHYSSVSMYSADISVQRSYAVARETRSASNDLLSNPGSLLNSGSLPNPVSNAGISQGPGHGGGFVDKIADLLRGQEEKMLAKAQQPLSSLLEHHLKNMEKISEKETPKENSGENPGENPGENQVYEALKAAREQIDEMINHRVKKIFESTLNGMF